MLPGGRGTEASSVELDWNGASSAVRDEGTARTEAGMRMPGVVKKGQRPCETWHQAVRRGEH